MARLARFVVVGYVAITFISVIITYCFSVGFDHNNPLLPTLSLLGSQPLESTIFTQCFVVDATALMFVVQLKFVHVYHNLVKLEASNKVFMTNLAGVYTGHAAGAGLFVLACFQESNAYYVNQYAGVFLYFFCSTIYFILQSIMSVKIAKDNTDWVLIKIRIILNILIVFFFIFFEINYFIALKKSQVPWHERNKWPKNDEGWLFHIFSTTSEWILLFLLQSYILTFYHDFKNIEITRTKIIVKFQQQYQ